MRENSLLESHGSLASLLLWWNTHLVIWPKVDTMKMVKAKWSVFSSNAMLGIS